MKQPGFKNTCSLSFMSTGRHTGTLSSVCSLPAWERRLGEEAVGHSRVTGARLVPVEAESCSVVLLLAPAGLWALAWTEV